MVDTEYISRRGNVLNVLSARPRNYTSGIFAVQSVNPVEYVYWSSTWPAKGLMQDPSDLTTVDTGAEEVSLRSSIIHQEKDGNEVSTVRRFGHGTLRYSMMAALFTTA